MPGPESTFAGFVKSAFYKACFCLGLGTATYYSYAQVQTWTGTTATSQSAHVSEIQQKVNSLQSAAQMAAAQEEREHAMRNAPVIAPQGLESIRANPNLFTAVEATTAPAPSVSPTPSDATAENKDGKPAEADPSNPNPEAAAAMAAAPVIPLAQAQAFGYAGYGTPNGEAPGEQTTNSNGNQNAGTVGTGVAPHPTNGGTASSGGSVSSSGLIYSGPGATHPTTSVTTSSFLSQADVVLLTSSMKASFAPQTRDVAGLKCELALDEVNVSHCDRVNHYSIHTSRWSLTEGLASDASFVIKASSGLHQLEVNFNLKLQDLQQHYQTLTATVYPTEVLVHGESRNGKSYRVFELKLPNLPLRANDHLSQVTATLVYEVNAAGTVLSSDSQVNFTRGHFTTAPTLWDMAGPNRAPAAREDIFTPDQLIYSMNLEKSL